MCVCMGFVNHYCMLFGSRCIGEQEEVSTQEGRVRVLRLPQLRVRRAPANATGAPGGPFGGEQEGAHAGVCRHAGA